jgi:hypothetical protein
MERKIYNVDFKILAQLLLLTMLRRDSNNSLLNATIKPLELLHENFQAFRSDVTNKMSYNSQVFSIQKMLNDRFDNDSRRIRIAQTNVREPLMLYRREEEKPVVLGRKILYRRDVVGDSRSFTITLPAALQTNENRIRSNVDFYKLTTTNYTLNYI